MLLLTSFRAPIFVKGHLLIQICCLKDFCLLTQLKGRLWCIVVATLEINHASWLSISLHHFLDKLMKVWLFLDKMHNKMILRRLIWLSLWHLRITCQIIQFSFRLIYLVLIHCLKQIGLYSLFSQGCLNTSLSLFSGSIIFNDKMLVSWSTVIRQTRWLHGVLEFLADPMVTVTLIAFLLWRNSVSGRSLDAHIQTFWACAFMPGLLHRLRLKFFLCWKFLLMCHKLSRVLVNRMNACL